MYFDNNMSTEKFNTTAVYYSTFLHLHSYIALAYIYLLTVSSVSKNYQGNLLVGM